MSTQLVSSPMQSTIDRDLAKGIRLGVYVEDDVCRRDAKQGDYSEQIRDN